MAAAASRLSQRSINGSLIENGPQALMPVLGGAPAPITCASSRHQTSNAAAISSRPNGGNGLGEMKLFTKCLAARSASSIRACA